MLGTILSMATIKVSFVLQASKSCALIQNLIYASMKSFNLGVGQRLDCTKRVKFSFEQGILNIDIADSGDILLIQ
jgi:hypothetical protein